MTVVGQGRQEESQVCSAEGDSVGGKCCLRGSGARGPRVPGETDGIKMDKGKLRVTLPISSALSHSNLSGEPMRGNAAWTSRGL